jgi:hypothetical protein
MSLLTFLSNEQKNQNFQLIIQCWNIFNTNKLNIDLLPKQSQIYIKKFIENNPNIDYFDNNLINDIKVLSKMLNDLKLFEIQLVISNNNIQKKSFQICLITISDFLQKIYKF